MDIRSTSEKNSIKAKSKKWILIDLFLSFFFTYFINFCLDYLLSNFHKYIPEDLISIFSNVTAFCIATYYLYSKYPIDFSIFGFTRRCLNRLLLWGILGGLFLSVLNFPYDGLIIIGDTGDRFFVEIHEGIHFVILFLIISTVITPLIEEIFFRAYIYRIIKLKYNVFWGFFISSVVFAIGHSFSVSALISSIVLCYIYEKTEIIGSSFIAHAVWNLSWYIAIYSRMYLG